MLPSRERLQALRTFANQATMALRAAVDFETLNARNTELAALHGTAVGLLERHDVDSVLTAIMQSACSLVGTPHGFLALVDPETDRLRTAVKLGLLERVGPSLVARGEGIAGRVWATNSTIAIDDYGAWDGRAEGFAESHFHATVAVPLRAGGEVVGVIGLAYAEPGRTFGPAQIALVERFAQLAALALENARLYTALQQSEELHRRIVDCSTDLISVVDLDGTIVVISPSVFGTLGVHVAGDGRDVLRAARPPRRPRRGPGDVLDGDAGRVRDDDRPCPPRRRQLGPARRDRQRRSSARTGSRSTSSRPAATSPSASASRSSSARRRRWSRSAGSPAGSPMTSTTCSPRSAATPS